MEQTDKERIDGVIKNISINPANLEHIANTGRINGSLLVDLQIALTGEHNHVVQTQVIPLRERLEKVEKEKRGFEKTVDLQRPLLSEYYAEIQRLREALIRIVNVCDNQNPTHESIWRIANELLTKEG